MEAKVKHDQVRKNFQAKNLHEKYETWKPGCQIERQRDRETERLRD